MEVVRMEMRCRKIRQRYGVIGIERYHGICARGLNVCLDGGKISERAARQRDHVGFFVEMFVVMIEIFVSGVKIVDSLIAEIGREDEIVPTIAANECVAWSAVQRLRTRAGSQRHVAGTAIEHGWAASAIDRAV